MIEIIKSNIPNAWPYMVRELLINEEIKILGSFTDENYAELFKKAVEIADLYEFQLRKSN